MKNIYFTTSDEELWIKTLVSGENRIYLMEVCSSKC